MSKAESVFNVTVTKTGNACPAGEQVGSRNRQEGKVPVLSCEGACIRGEIARLAANLVAKEEPYRRGCHGELLTVPGIGNSPVDHAGRQGRADRRLFSSLPWTGARKPCRARAAGPVRRAFLLWKVHGPLRYRFRSGSGTEGDCPAGSGQGAG